MTDRPFSPQADFLVCPGFFDYLEDEPAAEMLALFYERLAPGGLMVVGNFSPHNPTRAYMEWVANWYITYRTPEQFRHLASLAGLPSELFSVGCERLGVQLFLVGHKA